MILKPEDIIHVQGPFKKSKFVHPSLVIWINGLDHISVSASNIHLAEELLKQGIISNKEEYKEVLNGRILPKKSLMKIISTRINRFINRVK